MNAPHDESPAGAHKQDDPAPVCTPLSAAAAGVQPVAYAVFAPNGNIRIWSTSPDLQAQEGATVTPLYATPPTPASEAVVQDAARYRWLRDHGLKYANVGLGTTCDGQDVVDFSPTFTIPEPDGLRYEDNEWSLEDLDAAIDAALCSLPQQPTGERNGDS